VYFKYELTEAVDVSKRPNGMKIETFVKQCKEHVDMKNFIRWDDNEMARIAIGKLIRR
jgi:hypothetical protein